MPAERQSAPTSLGIHTSHHPPLGRKLLFVPSLPIRSPGPLDGRELSRELPWPLELASMLRPRLRTSSDLIADGRHCCRRARLNEANHFQNLPLASMNLPGPFTDQQRHHHRPRQTRNTATPAAHVAGPLRSTSDLDDASNRSWLAELSVSARDLIAKEQIADGNYKLVPDVDEDVQGGDLNTIIVEQAPSHEAEARVEQEGKPRIGVGICIRLVNADEDEESRADRRDNSPLHLRPPRREKQFKSGLKRALTSTLAERTRCTTALILCLLQAKCQASCAVRDESPLAGDGEGGGGFG
nr:unnamed protein product [Digitaria exilis]